MNGSSHPLVHQSKRVTGHQLGILFRFKDLRTVVTVKPCVISRQSVLDTKLTAIQVQCEWHTHTSVLTWSRSFPDLDKSFSQIHYSLSDGMLPPSRLRIMYSPSQGICNSYLLWHDQPHAHELHTMWLTGQTYQIHIQYNMIKHIASIMICKKYW